MAGDRNYELNLCVPFPTGREAQICYDVLRVDSEPSRSKVSKKLKVDEQNLDVTLVAPDLRQLRVAVSSFMEHLELAIETIIEFGPPLSAEYSYYKGS